MFNPADASNRIKEEFIDYISTSFSVADQEYDKLFKEKLNQHGVISRGPLVDIKDINSNKGKYFEKIKSIMRASANAEKGKRNGVQGKNLFRIFYEG